MATTAAITAGPASFLPVGALDDDALARRINAGDDRAFEELYSRYYPRLYRYCASVLGDPQEAEEALQSSMFSAYRALRAHDRELNLRPWLYRIAHNQCLDIMRRRRETDELSGLEEERGLNVSEQVDLREDVRQLRRDLAALAPEQREALVLREMGGLSHEEIARTLEATPAAAKQLIHDARRSLTAFESGRSLECADVQRRLSDQDGRVLRGGAIKSHLRSCPDCGLFRETMRTRSVPMRALVPPLSPVAAQGILASVLGGSSGAAAAGGAALAGGLGAGLALKIAAVGVVAVAGVAAAGIPLGLTERIGGSDASPRARVEGQGPSGSAGAAPVTSAARRADPSSPAAAAGASGGAATAAPGGGGASAGAGPGGAGVSAGADPGSGGASASASAGGASAGAGADAGSGGAGASVSAGSASASAGADLPAGTAGASVNTPAGSGTVTVRAPVVPPVRVPAPPAAVPPVAVPQVTVPQVTVPPAPALPAVPRVQTPPVQAPPVQAPPVTVPQVPVPQVTVPQVTVPPVVPALP